MKKFLLPEGGNFYKANLHCHTTVSDGKLTPEQIKEAYMKHGYSVVAYTDHDVLIPHPELCDENFLALNAFEIEIDQIPPEGQGYFKTCHLCFIALDPDNDVMPCYNRTKYMPTVCERHRPFLKYDESKPDFEREYTPEGVNRAIKEARESGFFVTYNHPRWSHEHYNDYTNYHGMHAMEICNYSSSTLGFQEYNEREYDDMLFNGERVFCISADDNHNLDPFDTPECDSFGGFTVIKAESLDYKSITDALVKGDFYASQGPRIHSIWYEDGRIHVTCAGAVSVRLNTGRRKARKATALDGELLEYASFSISPSERFVRITVTDSRGLHANSRAYFTDEIFDNNN